MNELGGFNDVMPVDVKPYAMEIIKTLPCYALKTKISVIY